MKIENAHIFTARMEYEISYFDDIWNNFVLLKYESTYFNKIRYFEHHQDILNKDETTNKKIKFHNLIFQFQTL